MKLPTFKRILIKLGTQIVTDENGNFADKRMRALLKDLSNDSTREFLIVTSGAVGLGKNALKLKSKPTLTQKQACASVGQSLLMNSYNKILHKMKIQSAQLLVTAEDLTERTKYLNFAETLNELLQFKTLPLINENDSLSTVELEGQNKSFGDNDKLSALIASKVNVDLLIILTNVDGIFSENPFINPGAQKIPLVKKFSDLQNIKTDGTSNSGRGGLQTKLEAARVAALNGVHTIIANGETKGILKKILSTTEWAEHSPGTLILPVAKIPQRKQWIGFSSNTRGSIVINKGAETALVEKHASLLPVGVVQVQGEFKAGEVLSILNEEQIEIARGICEYSSADLKNLIGKKGEEIIHRDDLVIYRDYQL